LLKCGERIWNLKRAFNVRMGVTAKDDTLPKRLTQPLPDGAAKGRIPPMDEMLGKYYELRGWVDGKPSKGKLEELNMHDIAQDLWD
jgi:aldehyde:ferredoxin oxidoreductase